MNILIKCQVTRLESQRRYPFKKDGVTSDYNAEMVSYTVATVRPLLDKKGYDGSLSIETDDLEFGQLVDVTLVSE
jgi:hypothetical protein